MGSAIARNLVKGGFAVTGFDIDPGKTAAFAGSGTEIRGAAAEAAGDADLVLTSLPSVAALDDTVAALAAAPPPGQILAELSTFPIEGKQAAHDRLRAAGVAMLDCPLSGTGAQAVTGDLALYGSGDEAAYRRAEPAF